MASERRKYVALARVSGWEQKERNISIPSQIDQIQKYCFDHDIELIKIYKEENSAYKGKRAVFGEMINFLKKSKDISGIIIFKWDRLSRNVSDFTLIDEIATEKKLEIISISEPLLNSYMGRYMIRDIQNRSVLYSEELSFRIKLGIRKKLQNGGDIGGNTPYGYKRIDGTYVKDGEKAKIVQKIFKLYSTGLYGYKSLAQKMKDEVPEEYKKDIATRLIDVILMTKTYCGKRVKIWNLSKEEYIFWGVDKPGRFEEEYDLDFVYPIITEELFNKCQEIKKQKDRRGGFVYSRTGIPKVFQCSCGRLMLRDDKKLNRYLKCPKQINSVFPYKCNESYINLKEVEPEFEKILLSIIPNKEILEKSIKMIEKEFSKSDKDRKILILDNIKKINELNLKNDELTKSFIENTISKQVLERSSGMIDEEINKLTTENKLLQNQDDNKKVYSKIIEFIKYLLFALDILKTSDKNKKSSQFYNLIFGVIENLKFSNKKVLSYQLKAPFHFIKNGCFSLWWSQ
ncbi:MAG: recombinase family protein, partial [Candidatus Gracilibacteria bacterium]|nr:recombinase family protein [Candidatus Gracilibacteria bacterium]